MVEAMGIYTKSAEEKAEVNGTVEDVEMQSGDESDSVVVEKADDITEQGMTSVQVAAAKELIKQFFADVPKTKCANCGANVPSFKSEGVGKIFQVKHTSSSGLFMWNLYEYSNTRSTLCCPCTSGINI